MMRLTATLATTLALLALAACARPEQVRRVARLSQPIAVQIQTSGDRLQSRMALQAQALDANALALRREIARARSQTQLVERDIRLTGAQGTRDLVILQETRSRDAAIIADPLSPLAAPATPSASTPTTIDLAGLGNVITGLDRMASERRTSFGDMLRFGWEVNSELAKLETEGASNPPAAPEASTVPSQPND